MDKLTDLELIKKIAVIEGKTGHEFMGVFVLSENYNEAVNESHSNSYSFDVNKYAYNPLDDALCHQLMIKHDIAFFSGVGFKDDLPYKVYFAQHDKLDDNVFDRMPNRAILLAIIEAHSD